LPALGKTHLSLQLFSTKFTVPSMKEKKALKNLNFTGKQWERNRAELVAKAAKLWKRKVR
jgi:hypothetical protein